jgi:hypothetical protein
MRLRTAIVICLAVGLILPAAALALRRTYFGPAAGGTNNAGVELSARLTNGAPVRVKRVEWHNVLASCAGYAGTATTGEFPSTIPVRDGKFHASATFNSGRARVTVAGKFSHHNRRIAGTLRVRGTVTGCSAADTGTVSWTAKQPAGQP